MKIEMDIYVKDFQTPNYVLEEVGDGEDGRKFSLSELNSVSLDILCNRFRDEIFKKAGKQQPPKCE